MEQRAGSDSLDAVSETLPATYERAADGEIINVRPYCSLDCQQNDPDAPANAEREDVGGEDMAGHGNQCCACGVEL